MGSDFWLGLMTSMLQAPLLIMEHISSMFDVPQLFKRHMKVVW